MKKPKMASGMLEIPHWIAGWVFGDMQSPCRIDIDPYRLQRRANLNPSELLDDYSACEHSSYLFQGKYMSRVAHTLNLQEGQMLAAQGALPMKPFGGSHLMLWRSTAYGIGDKGQKILFVPFIQNIQGQPAYVQPIIYWHWLEYPLRETQKTWVLPY